MKQKILIVEDNVGLSQMQKDWLLQVGYEVTTAIDEPAARRLLRRTAFDLILSDVRLPEGDGISLLEWTRGEKMTTPYIIMTEYATVSDAVRAIRSGAKDYLPKPVHKERLLEMTDEILRPLSTVQREALVAPSDMSVLILGANGTGKESVARNIHRSSERRNMPFVAVNCGVLPKELAPSLFFGHVKGAFTGADASREGYFGMAEGGTLFLDEIGTMPYEIQAMLLRVLQENTYLPVGGKRERKADVRIVAATNEDMAKAIRDGRFREDLYHRLNEFEIRLPLLSECPDDILPLAEFFRERYSKELRRETCGFTEDAAERLLAYAWPGNVRELQNKVRRAVLLAESGIVRVEEMGLEALEPTSDADHSLAIRDEAGEKRRIVEALKRRRPNCCASTAPPSTVK